MEGTREVHFTSSARTIDLLGRQQIAGASTALSEIFKNAHDAYATRVQVDVVADGRLLVVRDDGVGMSPHDFEQRWLTLAASKSTESSGPKPQREATERPVLGAKGIGRLAVAIIGRNVLIITRAEGTDATVALVAWKLFEIPGLTLDDIQVAVQQVDLNLLGQDAVSDILATTKKSIKKLRELVRKRDLGDDSLDLIDSVSQSVSSLEVSDLDEVLGEKNLFLGGETGTTFVVFPVENEDISELTRARSPEDHQLIRDLLGFFLPADLADQLPSRRPSGGLNHALHVSDMETSFFLDGRDLVAESEFFSIAELLSMDHRVSGAFDEDGYFRGEVSVYSGAPARFDLPWRTDKGELVGRVPRCGPFEFWTSAVEGRPRDSALDPDAHSKMSEKLEGLGGVYMYRNGVRVLPYGRPNFDWLGIEERRTKHLSRNYFSHRRMFGAIVVDGDSSTLEEKAGREGFISNQAYRDLRDILTRFFRELAAQFFVKGGLQAREWETTRDDNRAAYQDRKQGERDADEDRRRQRFEAEIAAKYLSLDEELPDEVRRIRLDFEAMLARFDAGDISTEPSTAGATSLAKLLDLEAHYRISAPADLGLNAELERDRQTYNAEFIQGVKEHIEPAREDLYRELERQGPTSDYQSSILRDLSMRSTQLTERLKSAGTSLERDLPDVHEQARALINETAEVWDSQRDQTLETARIQLRDDAAPLVEARQQAERFLTATAEHLVHAVEGYRVALRGVVWTREGDAFFTSADASSRVQSRVLDLQDEAVRTSSLVMRGMMLANLEHEFNNVISSLRRSVEVLGRRASDDDADLVLAVDSVQTAFEHLDGFLGVMSPLRRTSTTRPTKITGRQLRRFVANVFDAERESSSVELVFSNDFDAFETVGHRSVWYPVLVNLIDNAMFWASRWNDAPRVEVGVDGGEVSISDNGPGVSAGDVDVIWSPQFSRKPGGTGLGLSISRAAIAEQGYTVELDETYGDGARFVLRPARGNGGD